MEAQLHKGWLAEQLDEAASDYAMAFSPSWISAAGGSMAKSPVQPGLDEKDAARLREKLAFRYREWTGRDLAADLVSPSAPSTAVTPEMLGAAWGAWKSRHGGKLGPGPAFAEAIAAALAVCPALPRHPMNAEGE